jgi:hypothetical protein
MSSLDQAIRSRFFEKKQRKKLLLLWSRDFRTPQAQINKSLFASFSSEKEALPVLGFL